MLFRSRRLRRLRRLRLLTTGHHVCRSTGQDECRAPPMLMAPFCPAVWSVSESSELPVLNPETQSQYISAGAPVAAAAGTEEGVGAASPPEHAATIAQTIRDPATLKHERVWPMGRARYMPAPWRRLMPIEAPPNRVVTINLRCRTKPRHGPSRAGKKGYRRRARLRPPYGLLISAYRSCSKSVCRGLAPCNVSTLWPA